MIDELRLVEREAREQGDGDWRNEMEPVCFQCNGAGYIAFWETPLPGVSSDDTCRECNGTGKDMRGCEWCLVTHPVQLCPSIRTLLMRED